MTTTSRVQLATGRWMVDPVHSTADFRVGNFGRAITATPAGWQVTGHLTARGTSVRLAGDADVSGQDRTATVTAHTRLDRRALGIRAPRIVIGHSIDITVTATLRLTTPQ